LSPYQLYSLGRLGKGAYCLTGNRADGPCRAVPNRLMLGYGLVAGTRRIGRGYEFAISIEMGY